MDEQGKRELFVGKVFLAPLTKGGNLPFRRLCVELGAEATMGEMALAHKLRRGSRGERALLRRHASERLFGAQIAGRNPQHLADAARMAEDAGADFVDLNLGCPIDQMCRQGIGAALLKKPGRVGNLIEAMVGAVEIPVTAKIRLGWEDEKPKYLELGRAIQEAGASAVTLHARSRKQRYARPADWETIARLVDHLEIPVIGNGDLYTRTEIEGRWKQSACASVMLGRGALTKPWVFLEVARGRDFLLDPEQRLRLLMRYVEFAKEHFGDDERGLRRVREFLAFHLDFFGRYRPLPSEPFDPEAPPRIQTRQEQLPEEDGWKGWLAKNDEASIARLVEFLVEESAPPSVHTDVALPWEPKPDEAHGGGKGARVEP